MTQNETTENYTHDEMASSQVNMRGRIQFSQDVVQTIVGESIKGIEGVHSVGQSAFFTLGDKYKRGISVEMGEQEAALDLEIIVNYGKNIRDIAQQIRSRVANNINEMAGRKVIEVNIKVVGIHLPESMTAKKADDEHIPPPRVA